MAEQNNLTTLVYSGFVTKYSIHTQTEATGTEPGTSVPRTYVIIKYGRSAD
jgi:hypothetical protein